MYIKVTRHPTKDKQDYSATVLRPIRFDLSSPTNPPQRFKI